MERNFKEYGKRSFKECKKRSFKEYKKRSFKEYKKQSFEEYKNEVPEDMFLYSLRIHYSGDLQYRRMCRQLNRSKLKMHGR